MWFIFVESGISCLRASSQHPLNFKLHRYSIFMNFSHSFVEHGKRKSVGHITCVSHTQKSQSAELWSICPVRSASPWQSLQNEYYKNTMNSFYLLRFFWLTFRSPGAHIRCWRRLGHTEKCKNEIYENESWRISWDTKMLTVGSCHPFYSYNIKWLVHFCSHFLN